MVCDFLKPALIDNLLEVETRFVEFGGARMELSQTVRRAKEKLFEAQVTVALVNGQGKPKRLPPEMTKTFLSRVESNK
jgi:acyl-CoA thioester hydrolase